MKNLICTAFILIATFTFAQNDTSENAKAPKIVSKLKLNKSYKTNNIEVKLVQVVSDSRCPKGVSCVWAGEATVLVDIFENGEKIERKKVVFDDGVKSIFSSETVSITGFNVLPYPEADVKINPEDYYLQLEVKDL